MSPVPQAGEGLCLAGGDQVLNLSPGEAAAYVNDATVRAVVAPVPAVAERRAGLRGACGRGAVYLTAAGREDEKQNPDTVSHESHGGQERPAAQESAPAQGRSGLRQTCTEVKSDDPFSG